MPVAKKGPTRSGKTTRPVPKNKFVLDCGMPGSNQIYDIQSFEKFLHDRIKVNNKVGVLGDDVTIVRDENSVTIDSKVPMSKRYIKYLTKKFLQKQSLRDYIRVVSSGKDSYVLKYFKQEEDEEAAEEE